MSKKTRHLKKAAEPKAGGDVSNRGSNELLAASLGDTEQALSELLSSAR